MNTNSSTSTSISPKTDRLTQLQICFDQMMEQFCATLNYVDKNHALNEQPQESQNQQGDSEMRNDQDMDNDEVKNQEQGASGFNQEEFEGTVHELSNDLILKTRQILKLIDSLPGIDASSEEQMKKIDILSKELVEVENEKLQVIREKDQLLGKVNDLINHFTFNKKSESPALI